MFLWCTAACERVREEFRKNRDITDEGHISTVSNHLREPNCYMSVPPPCYLHGNLQLLSEVREAERFLRQNVVQATYIGDDTYSEF